ncbi:alginate lyase [Buttiauxella ferragutiae ATCC 51602]|jgi:poly(beta-D-mannuronate) lyase|uniref:Alginate lyase n=1 Tax=Buttiauxella ferragutiae ATCC 51602 TaxID=1354252 RepID=A0ABX2W244_9ENTR|nr:MULTISPECIES: polysaccharide lyase family 7 protein [Buttiauxella]OAT24568.1 alginate lyase [Buttiauxella ferragutiae ATCC 51602]TDN51885.1 alginate lyase [Buttiauxella sp. JUb87]
MIGTLQPSYSDHATIYGELADGIKLGEKCRYRINITGDKLNFRLILAGHKDVEKTVDISKSGYNETGQYMYYTVGVYNQNKTGKPDDYA